MISSIRKILGHQEMPEVKSLFRWEDVPCGIRENNNNNNNGRRKNSKK